MRVVILASSPGMGTDVARLLEPMADLQVKVLASSEAVISFAQDHGVSVVLIAPDANQLEALAKVRRVLSSETLCLYGLLARGEGPTPSAALAAGATEVCYLDASPEEMRNRLRLLLDLTKLRSTLYSERDRKTQANIVDPLTGLLNRPAFLARLDGEIGRVRRSKRPMVVAMMEIDHLSTINERHGLSAGDQVLKSVARQLEDVLRDMDVAGRIGGSEFALYLPEATLSDGSAVLDRLRRRLTDLAFPLSRGTLSITISIGITAASEEDQDSSDALNRADRALLKAKDNGRNRLERS